MVSFSRPSQNRRSNTWRIQCTSLHWSKCTDAPNGPIYLLTQLFGTLYLKIQDTLARDLKKKKQTTIFLQNFWFYVAPSCITVRYTLRKHYWIIFNLLFFFLFCIYVNRKLLQGLILKLTKIIFILLDICNKPTDHYAQENMIPDCFVFWKIMFLWKLVKHYLLTETTDYANLKITQILFRGTL